MKKSPTVKIGAGKARSRREERPPGQQQQPAGRPGFAERSPSARTTSVRHPAARARPSVAKSCSEETRPVGYRPINTTLEIYGSNYRLTATQTAVAQASLRLTVDARVTLKAECNISCMLVERGTSTRGRTEHAGPMLATTALKQTRYDMHVGGLCIVRYYCSSLPEKNDE